MKTLLYILILMSSHAMAANIFFINGDNNFIGPNYDSKDPFSDQARTLYDDAVKNALINLDQTTIIFYDPKGRGLFFRNKKARIDIINRGVRKTFYKSEVDATSAKTMAWIKSRLESYKLDIQKEDSIFYYYGEHIPFSHSDANEAYDLSHKKSGMSYSNTIAYLSAFNQFAAISTVILHTCNNSDLYLKLKIANQGINTILTSSNIIPNNSGIIDSLFTNKSSTKKLIDFTTDNNNSRHPFGWEITKTEDNLYLYYELKKIIDRSPNEYKDYIAFLADKERKAIIDMGESLLDILEDEPYIYPSEVIISMEDFMLNFSNYLSIEEATNLYELIDRTQEITNKTQINLTYLFYYF